LSADEAYDVGEIFYSASEPFSKSYAREIGHLFGNQNVQIASDTLEPRYRMAPAIIVDYPEMIVGGKSQTRVSTRACYTVGSGTDYSKIWIRLNLDKGLRFSDLVRRLPLLSSQSEKLLNEFLFDNYTKLAQERRRDLEFSKYLFIRIVMLSFADSELQSHLNSIDRRWDTVGRFIGTDATQSGVYNRIFDQIDLGLNRNGSSTSRNFAIFKVPNFGRGEFYGMSGADCYSLLRFGLSPTTADVYGITYEYGEFDDRMTDSVAHIASGELSFELGRLY
jgi:hypothetical protein